MDPVLVVSYYLEMRNCVDFRPETPSTSTEPLWCETEVEQYQPSNGIMPPPHSLGLPESEGAIASEAVEQVDLDTALVAMAEEMEFDWPELLPVERIKAGLSKVVFGSGLIVGLIGLLSLLGHR